MDSKFLRDTEAKIKEVHKGKLNPASSKPLERDQRRAAVAPAVAAGLRNKNKK